MKQPMSAAKKSAAKSIALSTSARYKGTPKVSFSTIDDIKKMGMTAALKKASTSSNKEYIEGVRRMYGEKRLAAARGMKSASPMMPGPGPASRMSARGAERGTAKKSKTKTIYNPRTGKPVTYTEKPKTAKPKPKAETFGPKKIYNRYTGEVVTYTTKPEVVKPKPKPKPAPKYSRYQ